MDIRQELIKYAKWYDRATMPEDAQTDEADLVQNVESYLQTEGKNLVQAHVMRSVCQHDDHACRVYQFCGTDKCAKRAELLRQTGA